MVYTFTNGSNWELKVRTGHVAFLVCHRSYNGHPTLPLLTHFSGTKRSLMITMITTNIVIIIIVLLFFCLLLSLLLLLIRRISGTQDFSMCVCVKQNLSSTLNSYYSNVSSDYKFKLMTTGKSKKYVSLKGCRLKLY